MFSWFVGLCHNCVFVLCPLIHMYDSQTSVLPSYPVSSRLRLVEKLVNTKTDALAHSKLEQIFNFVGMWMASNPN
jgi:hypothetical protein